MKMSVVQMRSSSDGYENLLLVDDFVREAAEQGSELVCFPENVFYRGPKTKPGFSREDAHLMLGNDQKIARTTDFARELKRRLEDWPISVSLGSVLELASPEGQGLPTNSHWFCSPQKAIVSYAKIHLFDFAGTVESYHESRDVKAGSRPITAQLGGLCFGLSICFDLRFAELYRQMTLEMGAQVLLVPSAFTKETGRAHWHTLLRARAIENLSYVVAPAQWGAHKNAKGNSLECYGHSVAYDPWGNLICEAPGTGDFLKTFEIDVAKLQDYRARLPVLSCAKFFRSKVSTSSIS